MVYLWDTNIIIYRLRRSKTYQQLDQAHAFFAPGNQVVMSIVSVGEIYSLAYQVSTDRDFDHLGGAFFQWFEGDHP